MAALKIPTHDAHLFTWSAKRGVVEESTLGPCYFDRVFDDACDVGFRVRNPKNGNERLFTFSKNLMRTVGQESELVGRIFVCDEDPSIDVIVVND